MKELYKVSAVVVTYRRENELRRALDSLATQTFLDFEIVLIDDNDQTEWNAKVQQLVTAFKDAHPSICLVCIPNHPGLGSARARNVGISASRGEFITFLDDDDLYLPEKIQNQYDFMITGGLDYSITDLDLYYDDDTPSERRERTYITQTNPRALFKYHILYHLTGTDTMMFKKSYLEKIGGFPPIDVGDDYYLMERAILEGGRFGHLGKCDVKAYVHRGCGGLSSGHGKIAGENQLYEHKKKFFSQLDRKSIRYIKMRHHAVLAFAHMRMRRRGRFLKEALLSFLASPIACIKILINR